MIIWGYGNWPRKAIDMGKAKTDKKQGKPKMSLKAGLSATGFVTAVVVVFLVSYVFKVELQYVAIGMIVVIALAVGIPLAVFALRENNDVKDENATCQPIMRKYWNGHSTKDLIADYENWTQGEHSSYSRVHFGAEVVGELQDAKEYEEALRILDELGKIEMKSRERFDYENYRDSARPQLLEGIEKEKLRAAERARNKNLRK